MAAFGLLLSCAVTLTAVEPAGGGGQATAEAPAEELSDDQKLVDAVQEAIFGEAENPVESWLWPPTVHIDPSSECNAFAMLMQVEVDGERRLQPHIEILQGFLDQVVQGDANRLAVVFGHEVAHILLKHVERAEPGAPLVANAISRQDETDADILGMQLALEAGFSYPDLVKGILRMRELSNYNSFEGLNSSHPSWTDRLANIDFQQAQLWYSTSAFECGVYFLTTQQYAMAEDCFQRVVRDFPKCYEAWANLGYAQLMRYCDSFTADDLRKYDLGQLVVGGFYQRPESLEPERAVDENLWFDAVDALREALDLKGDLLLAKANLAVAYLVHPNGKDVGQSAEIFAEVVNALNDEESIKQLDPTARAAILVNAAVAEIASGDAEAANRLFEQAYALLPERIDRQAAPIDLAIRYNRACMMASSVDTLDSASEQLETYLLRSSSAVAWWPLAYERYVKLCESSGVEPKSKEDLAKPRNDRFRVVTGITLADGQQVVLNEKIAEVIAALGDGVELVVVRNTKVHRRRYDELGIDLLATDYVLAIRLIGENAPAIDLRAEGLAGESRQVRIGMTAAELAETLGGEAEYFDKRFGMNAAMTYRFFPRLGIGVFLTNGVITEMIVAQLPYEGQYLGPG